MTAAHTSVVVGVGPGDRQTTALACAVGEAERRGAPLRIVHATGAPAQGTDLYISDAMLAELRDEGQKVLDDVKHLLDETAPSATVSYVLHASDVVDALMLEGATASVLIVGADDIPWPERLLGGAVAAYVARHAPCPVVVVPEHTSPTPLFGGIVVALDGETAATGPLRFAFEEARIGDHELHALYATRAGAITHDPGRVQATVGEVLAGWSEQFPDVHVLRHFALDTPEEACVRASSQAELLVMGRPHDRGLPAGWSRGLALKVLRHAWCPVAIVPADYRGA